MKVFHKLKFIAFLAIVGAVSFGVGLHVESVYAHEGEDHSQVQTAQAPAPSPSQPAAATYNYVAQPGDSFSLMARKAVQTYGITANVHLSNAQIIFAETNLTQKAGSPLLNLSQKVTLKESDVKSWVDSAQRLTDAQKQAWNVYAAGADFNTNNVGQ